VTEANKDVVRTYVRAWETADVELMESVVAPGFTHTMLGQVEDRASLLQRVALSSSLYSDVSYHLDELVAEGDRVAYRWRSTARHTGPMPLGPVVGSWLGRDAIQATGETIALSGMFIAIVRDGQLVGGWGEFDRLGLIIHLAETDGGPPTA
jgi:predicted ester cyclase